MSPSAVKNRNNAMEFTSTASYFDLLKQGPWLWNRVYAQKWGHTSRPFHTRGLEVVHEVVRGKGYPSANVYPVLVVEIIGFPRDQKLLHQQAHALRNLLTTAAQRQLTDRFQFSESSSIGVAGLTSSACMAGWW
jgi:hypothetical protein